MVIRAQQKIEPRRTLQISPQGYFWNFCEVHGRPIEDEKHKRLIFPDCWVWENSRTYNSREIPPPHEDRELLKLKLIYWTVLVREIRAEHAIFTEQVRVLYETSKARSAPISLKAWTLNDAGYLRPSAVNVDWLILEKDLEHKTAELREAESQLAKVHKEQELLT